MCATEILLYTQNSQPTNMQRPHHGFPAQRSMAGSEPLIQAADPHIKKLESEAQDVGQDGWKKNYI